MLYHIQLLKKRQNVSQIKIELLRVGSCFIILECRKKKYSRFIPKSWKTLTLYQIMALKTMYYIHWITMLFKDL